MWAAGSAALSPLSLVQAVSQAGSSEQLVERLASAGAVDGAARLRLRRFRWRRCRLCNLWRGGSDSVACSVSAACGAGWALSAGSALAVAVGSSFTGNSLVSIAGAAGVGASAAASSSAGGMAVVSGEGVSTSASSTGSLWTVAPGSAGAALSDGSASGAWSPVKMGSILVLRTRRRGGDFGIDSLTRRRDVEEAGVRQRCRPLWGSPEPIPQAQASLLEASPPQVSARRSSCSRSAANACLTRGWRPRGARKKIEEIGSLTQKR